MNINELEKAGKLLYGEHWQSELARNLNIDSRRIRHYMAGTRPIPEFVGVEVIELLKNKIKDINLYLESKN